MSDDAENVQILPDKTTAPWSPEQVAALNEFQRARRFHPFTCPGDFEGCEKHRELIATSDGWVCACGRYTQNWAHTLMFDPRARAAIARATGAEP